MSHGQKKMGGRILVVDDHAAARESVAHVLRQAEYHVTCAASAVEALAQLDREEFDLVITDLQMPGMDGLELIRRVQHRRLPLQILMITAHATISSAVEAMRQGAFDYLEKPFDVSQLERLVSQAIQRGSLLAEEPLVGGKTPADSTTSMAMVGDSAAMQQLRMRIQQVAATDETVLICGESGTGKELVARAVHTFSRRSEGPLVSLNCPALSTQLTESELFGHRKGAFTGADADRTGRFELARGGTILLDEITEIELSLQAKLLRVLQERTFERVGSSETQTADVRVVASTNRDLQAEVAEGRFRQDLYYRLAVVPLVLPALRERDDDVQLLADHFLQRAATRLSKPNFQLENDARQLFANYHWPGNVRELENIITRACVLNQGDSISAAELRPWLQEPEESSPVENPSTLLVGASLEDMEKKLILATLEHFGGHRAKTAKSLGIGVRTLSGKLRSYGFAPRTKSFSDAESATGGDQRQNLPLEVAELADPEIGKAA